MKRSDVSTFVYWLFSVALFAATSGCGDNAQSRNDDAMPDSASGMPIAVAVAPSADYTAPGILSKLDVAQRTTQTNLAAGYVGGDPILRRIDDALYIINRNLNNITVLDAHTLGYLDQIAIGDGSNPQDVAVVGNKLFVPALTTAGVVVAVRGSNQRSIIDLQDKLACHAPCKPSCVSAYAIDNDVYVACDLLEPVGQLLRPTGKGKVAVIDASSESVRSVFELPVPNPQNLFVRTPTRSQFAGDLLIATLDNDLITNGCIVRVAPGPTPSATCAIENAALQGTATHIDVIDGASPLVLIAATSNYADGQLRVFDLETNQLWASSISPSTQSIRDVAGCPSGEIVVTDVSGTGGLRVYTPSGGELTTAALPFGLPPGFGNGLVCYVP